MKLYYNFRAGFFLLFEFILHRVWWSVKSGIIYTIRKFDW